MPPTEPAVGGVDRLVEAGRQRHLAGDRAAARRHYAAALAAAPEHRLAHHLLGALDHQEGRHEEAVRRLLALTAAVPDFAAAWSNLVPALLALDRPAEALAAAREAVRRPPAHAGAQHNLAIALQALGELEAAAIAAETALALAPGQADYWATLAGLRAKQGHGAAALALWQRALTTEPLHVEARFGLAVELQRQGELGLAERHYRDVLARQPDHLGGIVNLGAVLRDQGQAAAARQLWQAHSRSHPASAELAFNLGCAQLSAGQWQAGWAGYERRFAVNAKAQPGQKAGLPAWDGTPLDGGTLLVQQEQGLGDTLQFVRLLPLAKARAGRLLFLAQPRLARLLRSAPWFAAGSGIELLADHGELPAADAWVPLLSLPHRLAIDPAHLPAAVPYLRAEPTRVPTWRQALAAVGKPAGGPTAFRIGLVWQGNPGSPAERNRSLPLNALRPLAALPGVELIGLQRGPGTEQLDGIDFPVRRLEPSFDAGEDAFLDTAAVLASLDLVVTSDTSMAHLAGALGRPAWVLVKAVPDWRWGETGEISPFYPTLRLFRQPRQGDWAGAVAGLARELEALLAEYQGFSQAAEAGIETDGQATLATSLEAHRAGRYAEAFTGYRRLLARDPRTATVWNLAAMAHWEAHGRAPEARRRALILAARGVELAPGDADARANYALLLKAEERHHDAEACLRHALASQPHHQGAARNLGNLLIGRGRAEEAIALQAARTAARPFDVDGWTALAEARKAVGQADQAAMVYAHAVAMAPADAAIRVAHGAACLEAEAIDAAREAFDAALSLEPAQVDALNDLGVLEARHGSLGLAVRLYRRALELAPDRAEIWAHLSYAWSALGRHDAAEAACRAALLRRPDHPEAGMALGMNLLRRGAWAEGFALYERRLAVPSLACSSRRPGIADWQGQDPAGKRLLVLTEQGLGDAIQFIRYTRLLKARGATLILGCRAPLKALLGTAPGIDLIVAEGESVPPVDFQIGLMSLPHVIGTELTSIPAEIPYLAAEPARIARWRHWLEPLAGLKIGLVWQGNPDAKVDRGRSIPLAQLAPLIEVPGVRLVALQKGTGAEQLQALPNAARIAVPEADFDSGDQAFQDSAALLQGLDLLITTDTSMAHLAGALGRPVWILLQAQPEWRWLEGRDDSPWYPTARLFRQKVAGDWPSVVTEVAGELKALAAGDRRRLRPAAGPPAPSPAAAGPPAPSPAAAEPPAAAGPPGSLFARAAAAHAAGQAALAETLYAAGLAHEPDAPQALHALGVLAYAAGRPARAAWLLAEARRVGPETAELLTNQAAALKALGRLEPAQVLLQRALELEPARPAGLVNLGNLLVEAQRPAEAVAPLERAVRLAPGLAGAWRALGNALKANGRAAAGLVAMERAAGLAPDDHELGLDLAHLRLLSGDLAGGFRSYEVRLRTRRFAGWNGAAPAWDGGPLEGRTLLIEAEQGLGDSLHFVRYLPALARLGGRLILAARPALVAILRSLEPRPEGLAIVPQDQPRPPHDAIVQLLSLPAKLGHQAPGLAMVPYLAADPARVRHWAARLQDGRPADPPTRRIGLVWQGNPNVRADRGRSIPLAGLAPLLALPNCRFIALQKEHGLDQAHADLPIERPGPGFDAGPEAFLDTAACLMNLDLLVACDTAVAHLAGALGRPTCLLLQHSPDWRWGMTGRATAWYPSFTLYRQPTPGDWAGAVTALLEALAGAPAALQQAA